ncbi:nuclear transport factor 2 family protein [Pseudosporangium ferrugineum]|uniref:Ketosteroid isomerase-like protein n=1 Tax=Pseudosporangium ferrugineum TaxID=439699 RepID=A0A2T0SAP1_9ACTN|nr:nuclear transport factor 2 family protein [Pseudosporangium ferrugineum]PRY30494.1 ketosteroid isomerase-like protein [Pseudosporangium ferrugineum]
MDNHEAIAFADKWLVDWNNHDLDSLLAHFAEDVTFSSPVAARMIPGSGGVVSGKAALRDYWTTALARMPDLRFEILATYAGIDTVVINFRNQNGGLVNEVLTFRDGLVVRGHGTYLT